MESDNSLLYIVMFGLIVIVALVAYIIKSNKKQTSTSAVHSDILQTHSEKSKLEQDLIHKQSRIHELETNVKFLQDEKEQKSHLIGSSTGKIGQLETNIKSLQLTLEERERKILDLNKEISTLKATEQEKVAHYQTQISQLNKVFQTVDAEKDRVRKEAQAALDLKLKERERQWQSHEALVKDQIKTIASRCGVEIPKSYPFKGEPDNVIIINDEYVVFDAKSPRHAESPERFDRYLSEQSKSCCKYTAEEKVRKEVFLVVPDSSLPYIKNFVHDREATRVYVIPVAAVEPVIRNLQLIENYHFAEELSPDDRNKIVYFIGKSVHTMKRRVQIDNFFAEEIFKLLDDRDDLPEEFRMDAQKLEDSINLNPPREIGKKVIKDDDLRSESTDINHLMKSHDFPDNRAAS